MLPVYTRIKFPCKKYSFAKGISYFLFTGYTDLLLFEKLTEESL